MARSSVTMTLVQQILKALPNPDSLKMKNVEVVEAKLKSLILHGMPSLKVCCHVSTSPWVS